MDKLLMGVVGVMAVGGLGACAPTAEQRKPGTTAAAAAPETASEATSDPGAVQPEPSSASANPVAICFKSSS